MSYMSSSNSPPGGGDEDGGHPIGLGNGKSFVPVSELCSILGLYMLTFNTAGGAYGGIQLRGFHGSGIGSYGGGGFGWVYHGGKFDVLAMV